MNAPWRLIPLRDVQPPAAPAEARARGWLRGLLTGLRRHAAEQDDAGPSDDRLRPIEQDRLERLAPVPPLASQHAALDTWRGSIDRGVVVRPDDGAWDAALDESRLAGVVMLRPPGDDALPAGLPDAVIARLDDPAPLHVTRLEGWCVRHHDGLGALRAMLTRLRARSGPWTADVTPWAWAWMRRLLPEAQALPSAWAVSPLDGEALTEWLACSDDLRVRSTGSPPDAAFFRSLAGRSRGEAGVARAIWLSCLRDGAEEGRVDEQDQAPDPEATVWMRAPGDVELPDTSALDRIDLLVAHAALLHGPSCEARITRSLTTLRAGIAPSLERLAARGLLAQDEDGRWRPRPEALPALDARLTVEGFARTDA